jgi:DNA helicase-2/ATP-dependent DNA helicase PcrA
MNGNQLAAIRHVDGPCCVIAGAGSGKTAVLVTRVQALIERGVASRRILAVTFSKKAAAEMREQIERQVGATETRISTFHSLGFNVLKSEINGFVEGKEPIREYQKIAFIKQAMAGTVLEEQEAAPKHISSFIGILKCNLRKSHERPRECANSKELGELYNIYAKYERHKAQSLLYDFDDMGDIPVYRLRENHALREQMRKRWDYILVDEYQDTNPAQDELLRLLAPPGDNIFVVGDDYQSIYGFRGADVNNILNFPKRFPSAEMIYLDTNYRSTPEIVEASNALIAGNTKQFKKTVVSGRKGIGEKPAMVLYDDDRAEAEGVARAIKRLGGEGRAYRDIAILYRVNSVSRTFEEALLQLDIPFVVQGGKKFFEQQYVGDVIDYLRLAVNPEDSAALLRVLNRPSRFFGQEFRAAVEAYIESKKVSAWEAIRKNPRASEWRYKKSVQAFSKHILWLSKNRNSSITTLLYYIYDDVGYSEFLRSDASEDLYTERMESVDELHSLATRFSTAAEMVTYADMQIKAYAKNAGSDNAVTLSTVHKAKGLEYPTVFVVTCVDGMFPHKDAQDREEERRILYVAMTRAIDSLVLSSPESRRDNRVFISPFLEGIGNALNVKNAPSARQKTAGNPSATLIGP